MYTQVHTNLRTSHKKQLVFYTKFIEEGEVVKRKVRHIIKDCIQKK